MGLRTAQDVIASGSVAAVVDYALELHRNITHNGQELKALKAFLRSHAQSTLNRLPDADVVLLRGTFGEAQIVFPAQQPRVKSGVNLLEVERGLPSEVFQALFVKRVVVDFVPDFTRKLASLPRSHRVLISRLVEVAPSTPKVNLR